MSEYTWLTDANGNRCSVEYWGSREEAQKALDGLKECRNCTNCSDCLNCSNCSDCLNCSNCSDCSRCSNCSRCSRCSRCSDCSDCSRCSGCSDCSDCSGCSDCSHIAWLVNKKNIQGDTDSVIQAGPPPIPVIENIHQTIYAAASNPDALNMSDVHTCENTHCRGGWAIALAGPAGYALEKFYNWELAAMLIYDASAPGFKINPARFYDENEVALADMKKLAEGA